MQQHDSVSVSFTEDVEETRTTLKQSRSVRKNAKVYQDMSIIKWIVTDNY